MGQLSSRTKRASAVSTSSSSTAVTREQPEAGPSTPRKIKPSRKSAIRNSIINFVSPSKDELTTHKRRKPRWSKPFRETEKQKGKGKEKEQISSRPTTPEVVDEPVLEEIPRPSSPESEPPPTVHEMQLEEPVVVPPHEPLAAPPPPPPLPPPLLLPPPRHFPPPGTLVVVQGVVNTTDTGSNSSNNNSSSRPNSTLFPPVSTRRSRSSTPTGDARNSHRLSSIMRRPTSIFNDNRRASAVLDSDAATETSSSIIDHPASNSSTTSSADFSPPNDSGSATSVESDFGSSSQSQRPLSPGSIDVLGTLLSVAAAATAASLFSSSSFSARTGDTSPTADSENNRPTSPTPTAGLGVNAYGPLDTLAGLGFPMERDLQSAANGNAGPPGQNVNRDRLRGAWDTLRDRLGLHNGRPGADDNLSTNGMGEDANRSTGAGETMISEMARALGTGLGLQEDARQTGFSADASTNNTTAGSPSTVPPAEGSFERFLFNLQADLRTVLSEDNSAERTPVAADVPEPQGTERRPTDHSSSQSLENEGPIMRVDDVDDERQEEEEVVTVEEATDADATFALGPSAEPSGPINRDRRAGDRVNLWRSYRFPPIVTPSRSSPLTNSAPTATTVLPPYSPSHESTALNGDTAPSQSATSVLDPPIVDIVVPVIIVGLQSVNGDQRGDHPHEDHESIFTRPEPSGEGSELDGAPYDERPGTPRGRPWHSRAATALRNLRPGRRHGMAATGANDRNTSRTFLIYVIGGYYPPNHHIVTGTDGMDSYEALWELAALLGQVKPPVATPEDIENSGLQIIRLSDIGRLADDGKVASNCIDRCLICLDNYEPEDDLRVMSCKHFFHKSCVDKWLQIGRNNCPACRTKGVSTNSDSDSPQTQSTPSAPPVV